MFLKDHPIHYKHESPPWEENVYRLCTVISCCLAFRKFCCQDQLWKHRAIDRSSFPANSRTYKCIPFSVDQAAFEEVLELEESIDQVRQEKAQVVKKQDYEEAARLRDKERNLQSDLEIAKNEWEAKTKDIVHDVNEEDIATVVAMMTGIPVNRVAEAESHRLHDLPNLIKGKVIGQD